MPRPLIFLSPKREYESYYLQPNLYAFPKTGQFSMCDQTGTPLSRPPCECRPTRRNRPHRLRRSGLPTAAKPFSAATKPGRPSSRPVPEPAKTVCPERTENQLPVTGKIGRHRPPGKPEFRIKSRHDDDHSQHQPSPLRPEQFGQIAPGIRSRRPGRQHQREDQRKSNNSHTRYFSDRTI